MSLSFTIYSQVLLFFGIMTALFAIQLYKKGLEVVKWFALIMGFNTLWTIGVAFEFASNTVELGYQFVKIEYIGIVLLPLFWLLFSLEIAGKKAWYQKSKNLALLLIVPIFTLIMVWTNDYHHLYFEKITIQSVGLPFPQLIYYPAIGYWIAATSLYVMVGAGLFIFVSAAKKRPDFSKAQITIIVLFATLPWLGNFIYQFGLSTTGNIEITPFLFIFTSILVAIGIYYYRLFDLVPFAKEKIFELIENGFIVLDHNLVVVDCNPTLSKYIQIKNIETIIGLPSEKLFANYPNLLNAVRNGKNTTFEIQLKNKQDTFYAQVHIYLINDNKLNDQSTIVKFEDITQKRNKMLQTEQQSIKLTELNQQKDQIFSVIANDLRAPVINISEVLSLLSQGIINLEEFKRISPVLRRDIIYTTEMLENLLHWSRSQLKGFSIKAVAVNLRNLVNDEISYFQPIAELKQVKVINDIFPNEVAYADSMMLQIVIRNIVSNALKYSNINSHIEINAAYQKNKMIRLCIIDQGIGMSSQTIDNILTSNQIEKESAPIRNQKSARLGLVICKEFMAKNGGFITIDSRLGEGSTVCVWIPIVPDY